MPRRRRAALTGLTTRLSRAASRQYREIRRAGGAPRAARGPPRRTAGTSAQRRAFNAQARREGCIVDRQLDTLAALPTDARRQRYLNRYALPQTKGHWTWLQQNRLVIVDSQVGVSTTPSPREDARTDLICVREGVTYVVEIKSPKRSVYAYYAAAMRRNSQADLTHRQYLEQTRLCTLAYGRKAGIPKDALVGILLIAGTCMRAIANVVLPKSTSLSQLDLNPQAAYSAAA